MWRRKEELMRILLGEFAGAAEAAGGASSLLKSSSARGSPPLCHCIPSAPFHPFVCFGAVSVATELRAPQSEAHTPDRQRGKGEGGWGGGGAGIAQTHSSAHTSSTLHGHECRDV